MVFFFCYQEYHILTCVGINIKQGPPSINPSMHTNGIFPPKEKNVWLKIHQPQTRENRLAHEIELETHR